VSIWLWDPCTGVGQILLQAHQSRTHNSSTTKLFSLLEVPLILRSIDLESSSQGHFATREHPDIVSPSRSHFYSGMPQPRVASQSYSAVREHYYFLLQFTTSKVHSSLVCISHFCSKSNKVLPCSNQWWLTLTWSEPLAVLAWRSIISTTKCSVHHLIAAMRCKENPIFIYFSTCFLSTTGVLCHCRWFFTCLWERFSIGEDQITRGKKKLLCKFLCTLIHIPCWLKFQLTKI